MQNILNISNTLRFIYTNETIFTVRIKTEQLAFELLSLIARNRRTVWRVGNPVPALLRKTSFANRQPYSAFQASETPIFTPDLCKGFLAAIRFIRLAIKPALTSTPVLFVKASAAAEKLLLLALKVVRRKHAYWLPKIVDTHPTRIIAQLMLLTSINPNIKI